jgi:hypothetical protein
MNNYIKELQTIQDKLTLINAYLETHIHYDDKISLIDEMKIIEALSGKINKENDKEIKRLIDISFVSNIVLGSYKYSCKIKTAKVFNSEKAKSTLQLLNYHIDDFYVDQERRYLERKILNK